MIRIELTQELFIGTDSYIRHEHHAYYDSAEKAKKAFEWLNTHQFGELVEENYDWERPYAYAKRGNNKCMTQILLLAIWPNNESRPFGFELTNGLIAKFG